MIHLSLCIVVWDDASFGTYVGSSVIIFCDGARTDWKTNEHISGRMRSEVVSAASLSCWFESNPNSLCCGNGNLTLSVVGGGTTSRRCADLITICGKGKSTYHHLICACLCGFISWINILTTEVKTNNNENKQQLEFFRHVKKINAILKTVYMRCFFKPGFLCHHSSRQVTIFCRPWCVYRVP